MLNLNPTKSLVTVNLNINTPIKAETVRLGEKTLTTHPCCANKKYTLNIRNRLKVRE